MSLKNRLLAWLQTPPVLRAIFSVQRHLFPVLVVGKRAFVARHADVVEVLSRDREFTISEINGERLARLTGPFILGMDRSPQYDVEQQALRQIARAGDLDRIRTFVAQEAASILAASPGRVDLVNGLVRPVEARLLGSYFGVPGSDEATLLRWMRSMFRDIFANPSNEPAIRGAAERSASELLAHLAGRIVRIKANPALAADDLLTRLVALEGPALPWLDDAAVQRNIGGLVLGVVETTSKFVTLALDELLRRPEQLAAARTAALAGDVELVRRYAWEAGRFNPHTAFMVRHCPKDAELTAGRRGRRRIPAGCTVVLATLSAMFDSEGFLDPHAFRTDRQAAYLHFGHGLHQCFGLAINHVVLPELLAALLRLKGLRAAPGGLGRIAYDGPFPDRMLLDFDAARP